MVKIKRVRTIDARRGRLAARARRRARVGSLILGLLRRRTAGCARWATPAASARRRSASCVQLLEPYETGERGSGEPSRWTPAGSSSGSALRPELVVREWPSTTSPAGASATARRSGAGARTSRRTSARSSSSRASLRRPSPAAGWFPMDDAAADGELPWYAVPGAGDPPARRTRARRARRRVRRDLGAGFELRRCRVRTCSRCAPCLRTRPTAGDLRAAEGPLPPAAAPRAGRTRSSCGRRAASWRRGSSGCSSAARRCCDRCAGCAPARATRRSRSRSTCSPRAGWRCATSSCRPTTRCASAPQIVERDGGERRWPPRVRRAA